MRKKTMNEVCALCGEPVEAYIPGRLEWVCINCVEYAHTLIVDAGAESPKKGEAQPVKLDEAFQIRQSHIRFSRS